MLDNTTITETSEHPARSEFADLIAAVGDYLEAEGSLWQIGDLLIQLCGQPGKNGAHNQSNKLLNEIARQVREAYGERARGIRFRLFAAVAERRRRFSFRYTCTRIALGGALGGRKSPDLEAGAGQGEAPEHPSERPQREETQSR
jgi:hypothetical protein